MTTSHATISRTWRHDLVAQTVSARRASRSLAPQKTLPCKYFYDATGSALFDEICELEEYYLTRTELQILRTHAPRWPKRSVKIAT